MTRAELEQFIASTVNSLSSDAAGLYSEFTLETAIRIGFLAGRDASVEAVTKALVKIWYKEDVKMFVDEEIKKLGES